MKIVFPPAEYAEAVGRRKAELQYGYDEAYELSSDEQRKQAGRLIGRIGSIDWRLEGYASPENQRDLSIKFHWGHNHRFADDLVVRGRMEDRHLSLMSEFFEGFGISTAHFENRMVLDVGCWTGGTSLTLKLLGASRVLALEEVRKYADAANELFELYGLESVQCQPASLFCFEEGLFDSIYFPGVVYHLSDPVLGLRRLFNRLRDGGDIFVESAGVQHEEPICWFHGNRKYHKGSEEGEFNRGGWNWFVPSPSCLALWMEEAGFDDVTTYFSPVTKRVFGYGRRTKYREITRAGLSIADVE